MRYILFPYSFGNVMNSAFLRTKRKTHSIDKKTPSSFFLVRFNELVGWLLTQKRANLVVQTQKMSVKVFYTKHVLRLHRLIILTMREILFNFSRRTEFLCEPAHIPFDIFSIQTSFFLREISNHNFLYTKSTLFLNTWR
jgi:hypothetical protein